MPCPYTARDHLDHSGSFSGSFSSGSWQDDVRRSGEARQWLHANDHTEGNVRLKKTLLVLTAVVLPLASIALLEGTAVAGKVTGAGLTTCKFGGTINFNPPLTENGTPGVKKEGTTVRAAPRDCSGEKTGGCA